MDPVTDSWVEYNTLRNVRRLGWEAGNSTLSSCEADGESWVFKEYTTEFRAEADQHALGRLIQWRHTLPEPDRAELDRIAAWPRFRVRQAGLLLGVLMPRAAGTFFHRRTKTGASRPHTIADLIGLTVDGSERKGASTTTKCRAFGHAIKALLWLHDRQVRVNDLREANILCARDGSAVYYVDCDAMMGRWGAVGPVAAPEFLQRVLPDPADLVDDQGRPTREAEFARLAWNLIWVMFNNFSLKSVDESELARFLDPTEVDLITRSRECAWVDRAEWRRLADRWVCCQTARVQVRTGSACAQDDHEDPADPMAARAPGPPPTRPMPAPTRRMPCSPRRREPHWWLPAKYRQPTPVFAPLPHLLTSPLPGPEPADEPAREPAERCWRLVLVTVAATVLVFCLALAVAFGGA